VGVSFVSLLLGLITGVHPVTVAVSGPVAAVELRLDGQTAGSLHGEPWTVRCDFGGALRPHKLEAIATASDGRTLGTAVQWVNLPRQPAEVSLSLEAQPNGAPTAVRVSWESLEFTNPKRIEATLDGEPIEASPSRIELPRRLAASTHFLTVRLVFPRGVVATAELAFGGPIGEEVAAELTAVPIVLERDEELPAAEAMSDWFTAVGQPLRVVAVERGFGEVVIVRDFSVGNLKGRWRGQLGGGALASGDVARLLLPGASAETRPGGTVFLFDLSRGYPGSEVGIPWMLASLEPDAGVGKRQSLADAVCVAGIHAAESNAGRAVVLVLGRGSDDRSTHSVATARDYLRELRVPLVVWTVEEHDDPATAAWLTGPEHSPVLSYGQLARAVRALRGLLRSQAIVWVAGRHLPQDIALAKPGLSARLAGS